MKDNSVVLCFCYSFHVLLKFVFVSSGFFQDFILIYLVVRALLGNPEPTFTQKVLTNHCKSRIDTEFHESLFSVLDRVFSWSIVLYTYRN